MKKSMLILILTALLSACGATENTQGTAEIPTVQTTQITTSTTATMTEIAEITATAAEITTSENQSETTESTTAAINYQKETNQENPPNHEQNMDTITVADNAENTTEASTKKTTEKSSESTQTEVAKSTENTSVTTTETTKIQEEIQTSSESPAEPSESSLSDYEKALEVYNFMTENGSGTCVQYAYQTYEMCHEYGLECYFAWTENHLYGHVANAVKIGDIWYVLDTQAGCFLAENKCGFTEIVDENENHIAEADIISDTKY